MSDTIKIGRETYTVTCHVATVEVFEDYSIKAETLWLDKPLINSDKAIRKWCDERGWMLLGYGLMHDGGYLQVCYTAE